MPQGNKRNWSFTLQRSTHKRRLFFEEKKWCDKEIKELVIHNTTINTFSKKTKRNEKISYGVDGLQTRIRYDPSKLNFRLSQYVHDIQRIHKVYWLNYEKLESGIESRTNKFSWGENTERYIPRRCDVTFTICNSDDVPHSITYLSKGSKLLNHKKISTI